MTARPVVLLAMGLALAGSAVRAATAQEARLPFDDPGEIGFDPTTFRVPEPAAHRLDLPEGLTAFVAEDTQNRLVRLTALIGASRLDDPSGREGIAAAVAYAMEARGPADAEPGAMTDLLYRLDARLSASVDLEHTRLELEVLDEDLDEALTLLSSLLRRPRLDAGTLDAYRRRAARPEWNPDDPRTRPDFEFPVLLYGDHPAGRRPTTASLSAITPDELAAFHDAWYVPNNIVVAVSGGIDRATIGAALERAFFAAPWPRRDVTHAAVPPPPRPAGRRLHVFPVHRLQGWAIVGHLGVRGRESDRPALEVANYILGGDGAIWKRLHHERPPARAEGHFRARLFDESRTVRGLTNDTSSYVPVGFRVPSPVYAVTSGRPESIPYLLEIIDREWRRIGREVSELDIEIAKGALTEGYFQMRYSGAHAVALALAEDRFFEGGHAWAQGYVDAIRSVTRDQVLSAARKYFRAEDLVGVLVGPLDVIEGDAHPLYPARLADFGEVIVHPW